MRRLLDSILFLLASTLIGCQTGPAANPSSAGETAATGDQAVLVHNGTVLTLDSLDTTIEEGGVVIEGNSIIDVGPASDLLEAYPGATRVDAGGGIIMPGLINAHTHVPMTLLRGVADDLELMDWLQNHIFPLEAELVDEEFVRWGTRLACLEMLRGGTTTFVDMYYFEDVIAEEADRCGMRAIVGETLIDFPAPDNKTWDEAITYTRSFVERWREHPRIIPAVAPHAPYTVSAEHLIAAHQLATDLDVPMLIHLAEDRAEIEQLRERTGKSSVRYAEDLGILSPRVLAAHMVWPTSEEIDLLVAHDVGVAHCPQSNMKVAAGVAPVPAMIEAGVAVGIGTDGPASNNDLDLWEEIDTAAKLHKVTALDPTVLPARQALRMATLEGARALGLDSTIGSLEVGKRADLIVVRSHGYHQQPYFAPYPLLVYSTKAADVDTVIIDGRVVMQNGRVLTLESSGILAKAREYQSRILELDQRNQSER